VVDYGLRTCGLSWVCTFPRFASEGWGTLNAMVEKGGGPPAMLRTPRRRKVYLGPDSSSAANKIVRRDPGDQGKKTLDERTCMKQLRFLTACVVGILTIDTRLVASSKLIPMVPGAMRYYRERGSVK